MMGIAKFVSVERIVPRRWVVRVGEEDSRWQSSLMALKEVMSENPHLSVLKFKNLQRKDEKLTEQNARFKEALRDARETIEFYGKQENLMQGFEDWECPSGEVQILCDEEKHTVEDGGCARAFLKKHKATLEKL